ncbi:putative protein phosphatase 2C 40 [Hibiscus syriacus]|uniref:PPM-type phosphatase domain-containing protein n=1 Tax=Hibiscus syriacus TaxID=106335 RepID=A0A6A3CXG8_HIBSY|nr:putative protein phosphatase 2C 40 [Hibiscus syriacus]
MVIFAFSDLVLLLWILKLRMGLWQRWTVHLVKTGIAVGYSGLRELEKEDDLLEEEGDNCTDSEAEIKVSFGYQCNGHEGIPCGTGNRYGIESGRKMLRNRSFSCLSGAALSANATLANTNICNGLIGYDILPGLDSPNSFRRVPSSPSLSRLDLLSTSLQSTMSNLSCSPPSSVDSHETDSCLRQPMSALTRSDSFLNAVEVQVAGGAAGEDRVQAVCSEENDGSFVPSMMASTGGMLQIFLPGRIEAASAGSFTRKSVDPEMKASSHSFRHRVLDILQRALIQAENDFLHMVEQEMEDRPDLVSVGSCVLFTLLHGKDLYTLNLGDSRAVLATFDEGNSMGQSERLKAIQLTDSHTVDNEVERTRLLNEHPDDCTPVVAGKVKGKLKVTRAFGVGYLKKKKLNDALMGILRVSKPHYDGLFDFFNNEEAVKLVHSYISSTPSGDPAKFLVEQLVIKAARSAVHLNNEHKSSMSFLYSLFYVAVITIIGFSKEELLNIPAGRRRRYHDDATVIVIILGTNHRTSKASTYL